MWQGVAWVWRATYVLVVVGAVFDAIGVGIPPLMYVDFGAVYLLTLVAPNVEWPVSLALVWLWVHLVVIQVPILVLLLAAPSPRGSATAAPPPPPPHPSA